MKNHIQSETVATPRIWVTPKLSLLKTTDAENSPNPNTDASMLTS